MTNKTGNLIAACFSLAAFAVAIIAGLLGGNAASSTLVRALTAMVLCYPVGLIIGMICDRVVDDHIRAYRARHPDIVADGAGESPGAAARDAADAQSQEDALVV